MYRKSFTCGKKMQMNPKRTKIMRMAMRAPKNRNKIIILKITFGSACVLSG